jgi:hypothetical protein
MRPRQSGTARRITRRRRSLKQLAAAACIAALSLAARASGAGAAVTLGQLAPGSPPGADCSVSDFAQLTVTSGNGYVVPGNGTVTSWSTNASADVGQTYAMKVFRKVANPAVYMVVGHDSRTLTGAIVNTFSTSIPVKPGDVLGASGSGASTACVFSSALGDSWLVRSGNLADGESGDFSSFPGARVNVSAAFVYSNSFSLGGVERNKKKGTASLTVDVPNPGELALSGKGVKTQRAGGAVASKAVAAAGTVRLLIKAKGRKKRKLNETGKVKVKPKITYTPTGGDPSTQSRGLTLKKR